MKTAKILPLINITELSKLAFNHLLACIILINVFKKIKKDNGIVEGILKFDSRKQYSKTDDKEPEKQPTQTIAELKVITKLFFGDYILSPLLSTEYKNKTYHKALLVLVKVIVFSLILIPFILWGLKELNLLDLSILKPDQFAYQFVLLILEIITTVVAGAGIFKQNELLNEIRIFNHEDHAAKIKTEQQQKLKAFNLTLKEVLRHLRYKVLKKQGFSIWKVDDRHAITKTAKVILESENLSIGIGKITFYTNFPGQIFGIFAIVLVILIVILKSIQVIF
jgi:hypothetical protein